MKALYWPVLVSIGLLASTSTAEELAPLQKGRIELSTSFSFSHLSEGDESLTTLNIPVRAGYFVSDRVSLEGELLASHLSAGNGADQDGILGSGNVLFHFNPKATATPFLLAGAGIGNGVEYLGIVADEDHTVTTLNAGIGVK